MGEGEIVTLGEPNVGDFLDLSTSEFLLDGFETSIGEGSFLAISATTKNVGVVDGIAVGVEEFSRESISSGENDQISAHDISLESASNQSVDVFAARNDDLATHVTTLLGAGSLIFDVDTSSTSFDE